MILHRIDKSWKLTFTALIVTLLVAVSLISVPTSVFGAETDEITIPESYFKVVDVRSNSGKLVLEVQHFKEDKTHWFYELYTFEGSEAFQKDRIKDVDGNYLLEDDTVAPFKWHEIATEEKYSDGSPVMEQVLEQFVPYDTIRFQMQQDEYETWLLHVVSWNNQFGSLDTSLFTSGTTSAYILDLIGEPTDIVPVGLGSKNIFIDYKYRVGPDWKYSDTSRLTEWDILSVFSTNHLERLVTGWTRDRGRTILQPMEYTNKEAEGADILKDQFSYLLNKSYKLNNDGIPEIFNEALAPVETYFELVDLRTQDSKTYATEDNLRKVIIERNMHYQAPNGEWMPTSLNFVPQTDSQGTEVLTMFTHPNYSVVGNQSYLSIISNDEDVGGRWYSPTPLTYNGNSVSYENNGVTWTYELKHKGLKLTSEPLDSRGEQSYEFVFYPLGDGVQPLRIDMNGNAVTGDIEVEIPEDQQGSYFYYYNDIDDGPDTEPHLVIPKPYVIGADEEKYEVGPWELLDNYRIGFTFDDSVLPPEAFPYQIDPTTTISITTASYDSNTSGASASYASVPCDAYDDSSDSIQLNRSWRGSDYFKRNGHMRFDTSVLPDDAIITNASMSLFIHTSGFSTSEDPYGKMVMDYKDYSGGVSCSNWQGSVGTYFAHMGTQLRAESIDDNAVNTFPLVNVERISRTGETGFLLAIWDMTPTDWNTFQYSTHEHSSNPAPQLNITYETVTAFTCPTYDLIIESPKMDGGVAHNSGTGDWFGKRNASNGVSGNANYDTGTSHSGQWFGTYISGAGDYRFLGRGVIVFDTSSLPDDAIIIDAALRIHFNDVRDTITPGSTTEFVRLVEVSNLVSNSALAHADYGPAGNVSIGTNTFGEDPLARDLLGENMYDGSVDGSPTYFQDTYPGSPGWPTHWKLNTIGKSTIDPTGDTEFGIRMGHDVLGDAPGLPGDKWMKGGFATDNYAAAYDHADLQPKFYITYTKPCAFLDSTSTVSQTTTSTFYTSNTHEDGNLNGAAADMWNQHLNRNYHKYCTGTYPDYTCAQALASSATDNGADFGIGQLFNYGDQVEAAAGKHPRQDQWNSTNRGVFSFDTSSLPDYGCTTGSTLFTPSKDGETQHLNSPDSWTTLTYGNGNGSEPNGAKAVTSINTSTNSANGSKFSNVERTVIRFDTSGLDDAAIITGAKLGLRFDWLGTWFDPNLMLVHHTAATNHDNNVEDGDFDGFGNVPLAPLMNISETYASSYALGGAPPTNNYNYFWLNQLGLDNIQKDDVSEFGLRVDLDAWQSPPIQNWASDKNAAFEAYMVESGSGYWPELTVYYTTGCDNKGVLSANFGFSVIQHASMDRDEMGASFSVVESFHASPGALSTADWLRWRPLKLTNDRDVSTFIRDSTNYETFVFTEAGREYLNNNSGVAKFMVSTHHDIEDLPPNAIIDGSETMVAIAGHEHGSAPAPRLMITHGNQNTSLGDATIFHTSGQTMILNLGGATWAASGATFDAERQNIINGLTGSLGTSTDWNTAVRDNMAVTEVVRTDDDTVTITFAAHTGYAPSAASETVSISIPASAHSGSTAITPLPSTFVVDEIPFQFTSFTPTLANNSGSNNLTLTGVGLPTHSFSGQEEVKLIKSGQSDIVCTSVSGSGGTSVVVSCPTTGAAIGAWDVKVTEGSGLNDTKSAALTLYTSWSSPVNGGGFTPGGSEYAAFAHDDLPYFTVHAFDEVEKEWGAGSSPPADIPAAAGKDAIFSMDKTRLVVSTVSNANTLWAYEFTTGTIGAKSNPGTAIVQDINDIDFSTNDNAIAVAAGGGDRVYMYNVDHSVAIGSFWTGIVATPASNPGSGTCNSIDFNDNSTYVAVGCSVSPYLHVWNVTNGGSGTPSFGSKLSDPGVLPSGSINSVEFSSDGTQIAIATDTSPYVEVYEFNGGVVGNKSSNPATLPTGVATGVAWLHENTTGITNLAVSHETSPYLSIYNFTTDAAAAGVFGTKLADPGTSLTSNSNMVAFHPNDDTLFVGQDSSPYMTAYEYTGVSDDDYRTYRYMANFDTSYLPDDAVITNAVLSLYIDSVNVGTDWQLLIQDGVNGSEPLVSSDNDYLKYVGGSLGSLTASSVSVGSYNDINLSGFGPISNTGITQLMLRHEEDIANSAPTVVETVDIEVGGSGTFPGDCHTASPTAITSDSDYNLCNSPNVPILKLQYTSVSTGGTAPDITVTADPSGVGIDEESGASSTYGTYPITAWQKGPIAFLGIESFGNLLYSTSVARLLTDNSNDWNFFTSSAPNKPFTHIKDLYLLNGTYPKASSLGNITASTNNLKYQVGGTIQAQMIDATRSSPGASDDESTTLMSLPSDDTTISSSSGLTVTSTSTLLDLGTQPTIPEIAAETSDSVMSDIMETSTTGNTGIPGEPFWNYIETSVGMPSGTVILTLALVLTIMGGVIAYMSFQSVAASYITIMILLASFTLSFGGILPWWMVLTFGLTGGIFVFARRSSV